MRSEPLNQGGVVGVLFIFFSTAPQVFDFIRLLLIPIPNQLWKRFYVKKSIKFFSTEGFLEKQGLYA